MATPKQATDSASAADTRRRWTQERVIAAIQDRQRGRLPLNSSAVVADDEPLAGAARRWFGSWDAALHASGIDPATVRHHRNNQLPQGTWTPERVLDQLRQHAEAGHDLAAHRMQAMDAPLVAAAVQQFGSWRQTIQAAGFDYDLVCRRRHWTRQRVLQRLKQLARERADLSYQTAEAWDNGFLAMAVEHFGSWEAALKAAKVKEERRTVRWSKSRILQALRSRASGSQEGGLRRAAIRTFGSWEAALRAAGRPEEKAAEVRCLARRVRQRLGLSLEEVGQRLGYSHRAISMLELGQWADPRVSVALRLARALEASVEQLFQLAQEENERSSQPMS